MPWRLCGKARTISPPLQQARLTKPNLKLRLEKRKRNVYRSKRPPAARESRTRSLVNRSTCAKCKRRRN